MIIPEGITRFESKGLTLRIWEPADTDTLNDWMLQDADTARVFGGTVSEDILDQMLPVRGAALNGGPEPVGFIGMYRIGDFATVQIVVNPACRKGWTANKIAAAAEAYAKMIGIKVLIASPAVVNENSRALLRWRKYSPLPVVLLHAKNGNMKQNVILMGKVL